MGHRLAGDARWSRDHAVHLLPAGRRHRRHGTSRRHSARAQAGGRSCTGLGRSATAGRSGRGGAMSLPFLLEIGTEEIPDWMIPKALENLRLLFEKLDIPYDTVTLDATPRRLVLRAEGLPERQPDREERVQGPAKSAPAQAIAGFARKQGLSPEELTTETTPKGEYYGDIKKVPGP